MEQENPIPYKINKTKIMIKGTILALLIVAVTLSIAVIILNFSNA
jgi:hypothetical protein